MAVLRTYIGETSAAVIASMPPEKREKSTLKYTTFLVTFSVCTVSVMAGPGESQHFMYYTCHLSISLVHLV